MTRPRRTEDVVFALIRQAIDDAHFHLCAADAMVRDGSVMEAIRRIERAAGSYSEAKSEFLCQRETIGHRRRNDIDGNLNELFRRLWIAVATVSRMEKSNTVTYNQLRGLRRGFLIFGGLSGEEAQAAEA
jgi:hypothetical protein